jgi:hypothetical protein
VSTITDRFRKDRLRIVRQRFVSTTCHQEKQMRIDHQYDATTERRQDCHIRGLLWLLNQK